MTLPTEEELSAVGEWLGFSASVIKSGEPWTPTCDDRYQKARQGISGLLKRLSQAEGERDAAIARAEAAEGDHPAPKDSEHLPGCFHANAKFWTCNCRWTVPRRAQALAQSHKDRADRVAGAVERGLKIAEARRDRELAADRFSDVGVVLIHFIDVIRAALQDDGGAK